MDDCEDLIPKSVIHSALIANATIKKEPVVAMTQRSTIASSGASGASGSSDKSEDRGPDGKLYKDRAMYNAVHYRMKAMLRTSSNDLKN